MTEANRGEGRLMSGSRAKRTAAMMEAAITMVETKRYSGRPPYSPVVEKGRAGYSEMPSDGGKFSVSTYRHFL